MDQGVELDGLVAPAFEQRGETGAAEAFAAVVAADEELAHVDAVLVIAPYRVRDRQPVTVDDRDGVPIAGDPAPHPRFEVGVGGGAVMALVLDQVSIQHREEWGVGQGGRADDERRHGVVGGRGGLAKTIAPAAMPRGRQPRRR
ncbi:hypothetical protein Ais01nite_65620 [Asanoa ishikariensis]|nr:hypothetical protein Ais01nite_65620 [Asanoa ishikariensis]